MGVAEEVARIEGAKQVLSDALRERGVYVPYRSRIDDLVRLVRDIPVMDEAGAFLAAHPVGSLYWASDAAEEPGPRYGGTWAERPSVLGGRIWERTA